MEALQRLSFVSLRVPSTQCAFHRRCYSNEKLYPNHFPTTPIQKMKLALGSSILAINNPTRASMVAMLGDTTGCLSLKRIHSRMLSDPTGRQILKEKPFINTKTIDFDRLRALPKGTFGKEYTTFMDSRGYTPDERTPVRYVDDVELAYVLQRYREVHDFWHVLSGMDTSVLDEIGVKWLEWIQTGLPVCGLSAVVGPLSLSFSDQVHLTSRLIPWAIRTAANSRDLMCVYYEKHFEQDLNAFREELKFEPLYPTETSKEERVRQTM